MKVYEEENITFEWHLDVSKSLHELSSPLRRVRSVGVFVSYSASNITNMFDRDRSLTIERWYDVRFSDDITTLDTTDTRLTIVYNQNGNYELEDQKVWVSMHLINASVYDVGFYLVDIVFCEHPEFICEEEYRYFKDRNGYGFYTFSSRGKLYLWGRYFCEWCPYCETTYR